MKILVIGGSQFLGRALVEQALARNWEVTTFNRGRSGVDLPGVRPIKGDREVGSALQRLANEDDWDAVIDVCGYAPRTVRRSVRHLNGRAQTYAFISSIAAIAAWPASAVDESSPLHECALDAGDGDYGTLKAGCERVVEREFQGNTLIIQPGLIIGPHENVGRLPWWLSRIERGGDTLAPGRPGQKMQLIDVRDVASFTLDQVSGPRPADRFLVSGPHGNTTFGGWLASCATVTGSDATFAWVDDQFLIDHDVTVGVELPLWIPNTPDLAGCWNASTAKAQAAGLHTRPVAESIHDTWQWLRMVPEAERSYGVALKHGIDPAREKDLLQAWQTLHAS